MNERGVLNLQLRTKFARKVEGTFCKGVHPSARHVEFSDPVRDLRLVCHKGDFFQQGTPQRDVVRFQAFASSLRDLLTEHPEAIIMGETNPNKTC